MMQGTLSAWILHPLSHTSEHASVVVVFMHVCVCGPSVPVSTRPLPPGPDLQSCGQSHCLPGQWTDTPQHLHMSTRHLDTDT